MRPPLDADFRPPAEAWGEVQRAVERSGRARRLALALVRDGGKTSRHETHVLPEGDAGFGAALALVERWVKFLVWSRGAARIVIGVDGTGGAEAVAAHIAAAYAPGGARAFERAILGKAYGRELEVETVPIDEVPAGSDEGLRVGGHTDGCRIGFDLGASDYKLAAVLDGRPVFTDERPWDPRNEPDPAYHRSHIVQGLRDAAAHLPRVDAIGGSAAGIYVDNRARVASLFRAVPETIFEEQVAPMFVDIGREWNVPLQILNDGDVAALAGAASLGVNRALGIAMGSSEAAGYVDEEGHVTGWLNELAFAPVDLNPRAPVEEWSGDLGAGASYFSQLAVARLAEGAGMSFPAPAELPERLAIVQRDLDAGNETAARVFETIGDYLGHTIPWYARFYELGAVVVMGRVTSGAAGEIIVGRARHVVERDFPELAERVVIGMPDEASRRVGQAVAAAGLAELCE